MQSFKETRRKKEEKIKTKQKNCVFVYGDCIVLNTKTKKNFSGITLGCLSVIGYIKNCVIIYGDCIVLNTKSKKISAVLHVDVSVLSADSQNATAYP